MISDIGAQRDLTLTGRMRVILIVISVALIVPIAWYGFSKTGDYQLSQLDRDAFDWAIPRRFNERGEWFSVVNEATGSTFGGTLVLLSLLGGALFFRFRHLRRMTLVLTVPWVTLVLVEVIGKPLFGRTLNLVNSYPAGSTSFGTAAAIMVGYLTLAITGKRWMAWLFGGGAIVLTLFRLFLYLSNELHYLSDMIAGYAVGAIAWMLTAAAVARVPALISPEPE